MLDTVHGQTLPEKCDVAPSVTAFGVLYEWSCSFCVAGCAGSWFHVASSGCGAWVYLSCGLWDLSSLPGDGTHIPIIGRWILYHWTTREVPGPRS